MSPIRLQPADSPRPTRDASPPSKVAGKPTREPPPVADVPRAPVAPRTARTAPPLPVAPDPTNTKLLKGHDERTNLNAPLFKAGVQANDVQQGGLGDCYFASAAAATAHTRPELIRNAISAQPNGTVAVNLGGKSVCVDRDVPSAAGKPVYGHANDNSGKGESWWPLLEKGYAATRGGYNRIEGDMPGRGLRDLLGAKTSTDLTATSSEDGLWNRMREVEANKLPTVTSTYLPALHKDPGGHGLSPNHVYAFLGTVERDGDRLVKLRNPHGTGAKESATGEFEMRIADYKKSFFNLTWAELPPK